MKYPQTAQKLNSWLNLHFQVITGATRAWLEFPFKFQINGKEMDSLHRLTFITIALTGSQEDCCRELAKALEESTPRESFLDATELLFIRREFEWSPEDRRVCGRLSFWNKAPNDYLLSSYCWKREGLVASEAKVQEEL